MPPRLLCIVLLVAGLHGAAHAQLYRCKDASGRVTIQDTRCPAEPGAPQRAEPIPGQKNEAFEKRAADSGPGANWSTDRKPAAPAVTSQPRPGGGPPTITVQETDGLRAIREQQERRAALEAKNYRPPPCKQARQQLELLKSDKPLAQYGHGGRVHVLEGKDRPGEIAIAEQNVARCVDK